MNKYLVMGQGRASHEYPVRVFDDKATAEAFAKKLEEAIAAVTNSPPLDPNYEEKYSTWRRMDPHNIPYGSCSVELIPYGLPDL